MKMAPETSSSLPETITGELGGANGAVYVPVESIVPLAASPPATPFTIHVTEPTKSDMKVRLWPVVSVANDGLRLRINGEVLGAPAVCFDVEVGFVAGDPHPTHKSAAASSPTDRFRGPCRGYEFCTLSLSVLSHTAAQEYACTLELFSRATRSI